MELHGGREGARAIRSSATWFTVDGETEAQQERMSIPSHPAAGQETESRSPN